MSDATTHLLLPYILAAQAQKHVTHNEALRLLDGLVQLSIKDRSLTAPPGSPADGDRYIAASGATGAWAGWDLSIALWTDGAWLRLPPRTGWRAWVEDEGLLLVYDGAGWLGTTPAALQNMALLGVGTTADASNPFSAKLNAALWTAKTVAEGGTGDLRYTLDKTTREILFMPLPSDIKQRAKPFIDVGTKVSAGQTLLIIEAMKTMNQIPSPRAGTVTQILVEDGQPVEFGQAMLIVE